MTEQARPIKRVTLSPTQMLFYMSNATYPAISGGYGSGKTEVSNLRLWSKIVANPGLSFASYYPNFDLVRQIAYPRWTEFLSEMGIPYELNKKDQTIVLPNDSKIIFRSMDDPETIIGYQVCHSQIDELDTMPQTKAQDIWRKVISRNRQLTKDGSKNTISVVSTPEGFKFLWRKWYKEKMPGSELFMMPTAENAHNLPPEFIPNLFNEYPEAQLKAYLQGQFVNLGSNTVYHNYDRVKNNTDMVMDEEEALHIGIDFNVDNMCAVAHVERMVGEEGKKVRHGYAVDEITQLVDTPSLIARIKERWGGTRTLIVYPDSSGSSRTATNASITSIELLRKAGFVVRAKTKNPLVVDRVATFNRALYQTDTKKRVYFVNEAKCPTLADSLETQTYTLSNKPDKSSGHDHILDATGYYTYYRFPVAGGGMTVKEMSSA